MSFQASRRELGELYTFFRLLADGFVSLGNAEGCSVGTERWPVAYIQRCEHDGVRRYYIGDTDIRICHGVLSREGEFVLADSVEEVSVLRTDFAEAAGLILYLLQGSSEDEPQVSDALESFLDALHIYDLEAKTMDRTDLSLAFWHVNAHPSGFCVRCRLASMNPLLDGGRTANLKFAQSGVRLPGPAVNKVNALPESPTVVLDRMLMIERLGGILKYADVADRVFRANLSMIDLHFPRLLAEMVRLVHVEGISRVSDVTERIKLVNPLKIKDELIQKHGYYEYKMKQFLLALALGMRPAKIFDGKDSAVEGMLFTSAEGEVICYHQSCRQAFADFLYAHTRFEKGNPWKDKYGFLERENGVYYFKLNVKIGFSKR